MTLIDHGPDFRKMRASLDLIEGTLAWKFERITQLEVTLEARRMRIEQLEVKLVEVKARLAALGNLDGIEIALGLREARIKDLEKQAVVSHARWEARNETIAWQDSRIVVLETQLGRMRHRAITAESANRLGVKFV